MWWLLGYSETDDTTVNTDKQVTITEQSESLFLVMEFNKNGQGSNDESRGLICCQCNGKLHCNQESALEYSKMCYQDYIKSDYFIKCVSDSEKEYYLPEPWITDKIDQLFNDYNIINLNERQSIDLVKLNATEYYFIVVVPFCIGDTFSSMGIKVSTS